MAKTDIEKAFRLIPVSKTYHLLGFTHEGKFYYDKCLPMGLSHSCYLFEPFSSAVEWIVQTKLNIQGCVHILDDFMFLAPNSYALCLDALTSFKPLLLK